MSKCINNIVLYRHIRLDKNEPFYIGIGNVKRPYSKKYRNKYWENIISKTLYEVEIILENLSWKEACQKEIEFIKLYGRKDKGLGPLVNMTDGGDGCINRSKESNISIGKKLKGFKHTQESIEKRRRKVIGRKDSEISKLNKSLAAVGVFKPKPSNFYLINSIPIIQYDLEGNFIKEWEGGTQASKYLNINQTSISKCCLGKGKYAGGFQWRYKTENYSLKISSLNIFKGNTQTNEHIQKRIHNKERNLKIKESNSKQVLQYDLKGNFIKEWASLKEAQLFFNKPNNDTIGMCCRNNLKTAYGYKWVYK